MFRKKTIKQEDITPAFQTSEADEKHCQYLVDRFRQLGNSTSRWGLLFFVAVLYTWVVSIQPKKQFISDYITSRKKQEYFDKLIAHAERDRNTKVKELTDSVLLLNRMLRDDSLNSRVPENRRTASLLHVNRKDEIISTLQRLNNTIRKTMLTARQRWELRQSLSMAMTEKGYVRDSIVDTIKKQYFFSDILIARAAIQKADVKNNKDSLLNKTNILFNVPGLTSISLGFKMGLFFWMLLAFILLTYFFTVRLKMISYLKKIFEYKRISLRSPGHFDKLDLQMPFWFAPVSFANSNERNSYNNLVGWKFRTIQNVLCILFLCVILFLLFYVAWISWHLHSADYFEAGFAFKFLTVFLTASCLLLFLLWLQPVTFSSNFQTEEHFSVKRRELLKAGLSAGLFLLLIPVIGRALPMMKGETLFYKRSRRKKTVQKNEHLADGFYVRKRGVVMNVHYYYKGHSISARAISKKQLQQFEKKLKPFNLVDYYITNGGLPNTRIPHWQFVLEAGALEYIKKDDPVNAIHLLMIALRYSKRNISAKTAGTQQRISNLLFGIITRFEARLKQENKYNDIQRDAMMMMHNISDNLGDQDISFYIPDPSTRGFQSRWVNSKNFPWALPGLVF